MRKQRLNNLLGALALALNDRIEDAIAHETGMHGSIADALVLLSQAHTLTIDALARQLMLVHSSAVRLAERMAQEGFVEREPGEDKRTVVLTLTEAGHDAVQQVLAARGSAISDVTRTLTPEQCAQLMPICEQLVGALAGDMQHAIRVCRLCDEDACDLRRCPSERAYRRFVAERDAGG
ncbi:MarR family winged helix-turn-helix transcriptional regulator [Burkholderia arboris]|uniref:MarR family winged helix-turn-helix transcriptional regulator n=1 Tax=Burkholderia arboris TaxID=488730 RepID=UPI00158A27D5|nr:MarR family transcriptional regulator [Burkholderia arboris]